MTIFTFFLSAGQSVSLETANALLRQTHSRAVTWVTGPRQAGRQTGGSPEVPPIQCFYTDRIFLSNKNQVCTLYLPFHHTQPTMQLLGARGRTIFSIFYGAIKDTSSSSIQYQMPPNETAYYDVTPLAKFLKGSGFQLNS